MKLPEIKTITDRISLKLFGIDFKIRCEHDNEFENGRIFIQITYESICQKESVVKEWHGRKWYLSRHMTVDEIIKTCYAAFESCVKHEVMEAFKVDGITLFNPHVNYEELLRISNNEVKRN